jgi:hypothetical protein
VSKIPSIVTAAPYYDWIHGKQGYSSLAFPEITSYQDEFLHIVPLDVGAAYSMIELVSFPGEVTREFNMSEVTAGWVANEALDEFYTWFYVHQSVAGGRQGYRPMESFDYAYANTMTKSNLVETIMSYLKEDRGRQFTFVLPDEIKLSLYYRRHYELALDFVKDHLPYFGIAPHFYIGHVTTSPDDITGTLYRRQYIRGGIRRELSEDEFQDLIGSDTPLGGVLQDLKASQEVLKINVPILYEERWVDDLSKQPMAIRFNVDKQLYEYGVVEMQYVIVDNEASIPERIEEVANFTANFFVDVSQFEPILDIEHTIRGYNQRVSFELQPYQLKTVSDIQIMKIYSGVMR